MKMKNTLSAIVVAMAAFAAPFASRASTGDIVDIRVVDTDEMTFGDRSSLSPKRCTADNPLVAGDNLYIRVRMLVRNWPNVIGGTEEPETWYFANLLGSSLLYPPKLGLMIGDRAAYAEYSEYGPEAWQKSGMLDNNDAGTPSAEWRFYTDFYFCYKVQPGDLGLPVKLMNSTGTGPASTDDDDTGYYLLNCGPSSFWALQSTAGVEAKFSYGPEVLPVPASKAWPDGIPGDTALRNYDLSAEGAYVKTIDFDKINAAGDPYSEGDIWRDVYPGMSAAPGTLPTLIVGGGASASASTVYLWSSDESVVVPVASGANTVSDVDVGGETKKVLKVVIPAGAESATFSMMGADATAVGATAKIYMSPAQGAVYKPSGELDEVTVSRWVQVITAPEPTVSISVGGQSTDTVTADADYVTAKKQLVIKMEPACDYPVTVRLNAFVSGDDTLTSLQDIYDENIIRIADGDYGGDPLDQETIDVEIPATKSVVYKNIYVLGGTAKTSNKGITFSTTKISGPDNVTTKGSCTLRINRSTPAIADSDPAFSTEGSPSTITVVSGSSVDFGLTIEDAYRELNDTATGYTFKWACDTEEIDDATGVTMNDDGLFEATAEFNAITDGTELTLCVVNPDGKTSAKVKYNLVVTDAKKTTIAFQDPSKYVFPESDSAMENVVLGLSQPYNSGVSYIFLESDDPASFACVDSSLKTSGAQVDRGRTTTVMPFYQMRFLDGAANVTVKAVLYKNSDHSNRLTTYTAGTLSFAITNVPPQVMSVTAAGQYLTPDMAGQTIDPVSRGVAKSFTLVADDVSADLPTVSARWIIDGTQYETTMDPANPGQTLAVKHTFANAKDKAQVRVYVKDKDMPTYPATPNFMFYVPVSEKPGVTIDTNAEGGIFMETAKSVSTITVRLSEPASAEITVRFTVGLAADGGFLKLRTVAGSVEQALDDEGKPIPGAYDLTFASGVTTKTLIVSDMDGTNDTWAGLDLNASVTTETTNPDGVKWCDFYTAAESVMVRILNEEPQILRPTEAEEAYTNMNASANTPYAVMFACTDVDADLASNIVVEISVDGTGVITTNVNSSAVNTYSVEFSGEGAHVVEIAFTDKDGMTSRRTLNFYVQPAKNLQLRAHGPANSMATENGLSVHYGSAAGIGAGRVYAGGTGPVKVSSWVHEYSFSKGAKSVVAYAYGYKADGSYDDGSLVPGPDAKIDANGNWSKGDDPATEDCFNYTDWIVSSWSRGDLDSFVYGWVFNLSESTTATTGGAEGSETVRLQPTSAGETVIVLPDAESNTASSSSSGGNVSTSLPKQYWEAVFSREWLPADNCGDINADGIPDLVLRKYGFGIVDVLTGKIADATDGEGDLTDLSTYNKDLDKDGGESPDFLPSTGLSMYGSLIPGLAGTWDAEFSAKLEVRGYHDGLNDALIQLGINDNGRSVRSDRVYAKGFPAEAGGTDWRWTEDCTISELEFFAWTEYAAAHGLDWTDENAWQLWSPERPTNPVLDDTDGDGFSDGYEYYFWYRAHVGYFDYDSKGKRVHKRISGRRYDPANPGEGTLITAEEIEKLMDPRVAYNAADAKTRDTDNDGLPDLLEFEIGTNPLDFDTDGDGLADGWELMIAGLNPLLVQSANDALNDAERNYDGDAMAITSYKLEQAESPVPKHPEIAQFTTFAVADPDDTGDWEKIQWYAVKGEVKTRTDTWFGWYFKLADGTEVVSFAYPYVTDDGRLAYTISRADANILSMEKMKVVDDSDPENPVETEEDVLVAGWPIRLEAGTLVDVDSIPDYDEDEMVYVYCVDGDIAEKDAFGVWVYGKGTGDANRGDIAESAAEYGCLALGGPRKALDGACICAMPSKDRDVALLHYLVYQQFGFDPRTAWSPKNPLAARWGKTANGDVIEDIDMSGAGAYCAVPARTRAYTTYDEFLVYSFFLNNGCDMGGYAITIANKAPELAKTWFALTTNPQGPNEPGNIKLNAEATGGESDAATEYYFGRDSENGADTDGDGVPDGWELYVMAGPKKKGAFVFAPPYAGFEPALAKKDHPMPKSYYSPFVDSAQKNDTNNPNYDDSANDSLNEFMEFESTDAMNYYATVYDGSEALTVKHGDGEWKWLNKFFPTDPWSKDTDGDGLSDSAEKGYFAYSCPDTDGPVDGGTLRSIPGGGLNPNSVDTDNDGLPDPWEYQFKGKTPFPGDLPAVLAENGDKSKNADGEAVGNYLQGLVDGMDGTVKDAYSYPIKSNGSTNELSFVTADGFKQVVNRDYDRDGLDNWQEYQTGMMRCWRYDDSISPWIPIPKEAYFSGNSFSPNYELIEELYGVVVADEDDFWTKTLVDKTSPIYNPGLVMDVSSGAQYLSPVTNVWDSCYIDTKTGGGRHAAYYWFYNRIGDTMITKDFWPQLLSGDRPTKYACCSPVNPDSDGDGMDDYYELFHGMNPLLGMSGYIGTDIGPRDLVCDAWDGLPMAWGSIPFTWNYWQAVLMGKARGNGYDFEVFPWMNGVVDADPDGDGLPNQTEALLPKLSAPELHSDPTPLWMTDSSYEDSLVCRFFRMPTRFDADIETPGETFFDGEKDREFKDFPGWLPATETKPARFGDFKPDSWKLSALDMPNWMFSFEENEGYDSDHDGLSDVAEKEGKYRKATDVLDADSPRRRQAMYFQGPERPSALQTMPQVVEEYPVQAMRYPDEMAFRTYTVECWVKPESLDDSVIIERAIAISIENPADEKYLRTNFQIGIRDGYWYTKFDPYTTRADDAVTAVSKSEADATKWTHLAATYDGTDLVLYVNGVAERTVRSGLLPTCGSQAVVLRPGEQAYMSDVEYESFAIIVGASAANGAALDLTAKAQGSGWSSYTRFYKGWVDEIRIWDGARTAAEISGSMRTRFTSEMVEENRNEFFEKWSLGRRRDERDENGNPYDLLAELRYHWSFDSIFGAENEAAVATAPHGFNDVRAVTSRAEGYEVPWWSAVLDKYEGTVYNDRAWVPWIPSTVAHMPRFDGTTLDSVFWSDDFMGDEAGTYRFSRTAEPVSRWTQFNRNGTTSSSDYGSAGSRYSLVNLMAAVTESKYRSVRFEFTGRHLTQQGDDLLPLGGAYARFCDNDVGLWDGQGASSNWEVTGTDADGDGLPDWWEQYADENYRRAGMDPSESIRWETIVSYNGVEMTAGEAYLRDLARGSYMNELGETVVGSGSYENTADEDFSGVPDWWEEMYGITGEFGLDDHDNDGLPNYAEYLLSEVFKFEGVAFDPTHPRSVDNYTLDYFYRVGSLYVGEIFTDHDQVDDVWEDVHRTMVDGVTQYASRFAYDAESDVDMDGWSNRSENRAAYWRGYTYADTIDTWVGDSNDYNLKSYPQPTLTVRPIYNGDRPVVGKTIIVRAKRNNASKYDATFIAEGEDAQSQSQQSEKTGDNETSGETGTGLSKIIGITQNGPKVIHGHLHPGHIAPDADVLFQMRSFEGVNSYTWHCTFCGAPKTTTDVDKYDEHMQAHGNAVDNNGVGVVLDNKTTSAAETFAKTRSGPDGRTGKIVTTSILDFPNKEVGAINFFTGEYEMDLEKVTEAGCDLYGKFLRVMWNYKIGKEWPQTFYFSVPSDGRLREGLNTVEAFIDVDGNGEFDPGEPYGVVNDVDISWGGATVEIELTDESPVTPRFDVFAAGTMQVATTNIADASESSSGGSSESDSSAPTGSTRVRVVRWKIDDAPIYDMAVAPQVVLDKVMDSRVVTTLTEADFLDEDSFDLDWDNFYSGVVQNAGVRFGNYRVVKADYLVFFGDGEVSWLNSSETNKWLTASKQVITRYYGASRVIPQPVSPGSVSPAASAMGIVNTANPTFTWTIDAPDREAYTAFRIVVTNAAGIVYDSGVRRAPARDGDGVYRWSAPLYVDDMTTSGQVFANKSTYGWRVSMYNSKYRTDSYSAAAPFYLEVQTNAYSTGTAKVGVRYFGPAASYARRVVRVQAFASPDFTGIPVAAGYVKDALTLVKTGEEVAANCQVVGLPEGKYYLRAFIDSNTNGVCDVWESSGYLCARDGTSVDWLNPTAITVGPGAGISEVAEIYLEDADTDNDGLPDSWEFAEYGSRDVKDIELLSETPAGEELVNASLVGALELRENAQVPAAGLATRVRSKLGNAGTLALALGVNPAGYDSFAAAISGSVSDKLAEDGVKISSLSFVDGKVSITVDVETESGSELTGPLASSVAPKSADLEVVAKVYWKQSLTDAQWTLVAEKTFVAGSGETEIDAGAAVNGTSGFYKVVVEEK